MAKDVREQIIARLTDGESLGAICRSEEMPAWSTVHRWMDDDAEFTGRITHAREAGYLKRADEAIAEAKKAEDAALGRLAFDAERWYLGKLSNAFSDNKPQSTVLSGKVIHGIEIEIVNKAAG